MLLNIKLLFKDSFFYGASSMLSQFASLFLVPFYTRELAPGDYGVFSIAAMLTGFLAPIGALGMDGALFRYYSMSETAEEKMRFVSSATTLKTAGMLVLLAILVPLFSFINASLFEGRLTLFQYALILATFAVEGFTVLTIAVLRSDRKVMRIARNNIITLVVSLAISLWLVIVQKMKVDGVLLAGLFASSFKAMLYLNESVKLFSFGLVKNEAIKKLLSYGLPVIPHKLQAQAITLFTIFIINHKLGIVSAGLYAVAQKMSKPLSFLVSMVQQSWTPFKFQMHKTEKNPQEAFRDIISFYWILLLFLWGTLSLVTPYLFRLLVHQKYWEGIPYVPFIMFLSVSQGFYFTLTTGFELSSKQYKMIQGSFWGMIAMIGASFLTFNFFPPYLFILCQSLAFFVMGFVLLPEARRMIRIEYPFVPALGLCMFTICCIFLGNISNNLLELAGTGLLMFIGFVIASRFLLPITYWNRVKVLMVRKFQISA